jgi:hypothetical protein
VSHSPGQVLDAKKENMMKKRKPVFSSADWRDIYDALMDAANAHHSGPKADRYVDLARRIREEVLP